MTTTQVPHRLLTVLLAAVAPLAFTLAAGVWVMTFADELPNPVAIHWGADGRPDGFGSLASSFGLILIVTLLMIERSGYRLTLTGDERIDDVVVSVADGSMNFGALADWFRSRLATSKP